MKPKEFQDEKSAVELAESSEWSALDRLITAQPEHADDMDDFGMMPLHWACTDTHVPLRIVKKLVDVAPSALVHKNKGGLLPLHIAVKAATKVEVLRALVQAAPDVAFCLFEETPTGETPIDLARSYQLSDDKVSYLMDLEEQLRSIGKAPDRPGARFQALLNQVDDTASVCSFRSLPTVSGDGTMDDEWTNSRATVNAVNSALRLPDGLAGVPLPPRWRLDKRCNICQLKFSYFKTRHHCRSCGESVCSTHSNKRLQLDHMGLKTPQRVCILCYDDLRENGAPSAVVNMYGHGRHSPKMTRQKSTPNTASRPPLRSINSTVSLTNTSSSSRDSAPQTPPDAEAYLHRVLTPHRTDGIPTLTKDLPFEADSSIRTRAWSVVDKAEKYHEMQEQLRELESHVQELSVAKSRIEMKLEDASYMTAEAKKERNAVHSHIAELRKNRIIDINRLSLDDDDDTENRDNNENPADFTTSFVQGRHRKLSQQVEKNIELIEDIEVDVAETCNYLGQVFLDRGDYNNAVVEFRKSIEANRKDVDVWTNLARALHGSGDYYDGEIAIRRALDLEPKNYSSLSTLGKILHSKGEHDKAVQVFREALSLIDQEDYSDDDVGSMTVGW